MEGVILVYSTTIMLLVYSTTIMLLVILLSELLILSDKISSKKDKEKKEIKKAVEN